MLLFSGEGFEFALNEDEGFSVLGVGVDADGFLDASGTVASAVVLDGDGACAAWGDRFLGEVGDSAAAVGLSLVDDEFGLTYIGESEDTSDHGVVGIEFTEVDGGFLEPQYRVLLCTGLDGESQDAEREKQ